MEKTLDIDTQQNNFAVNSMTAFGRYEGSCAIGAFHWEIKTVNHRYLDVTAKLPENFRDLESIAREKLRHSLARGKCELALTVRADAAINGLHVDHELLAKVIAASVEIQQVAKGAAALSTQQLMNWPGVLKASAVDSGELKQQILQGLDLAIVQLLEARATEGAKMATLIEERLSLILALVSSLENDVPKIVARHQKKLHDKLEELNVELDEERLAQEVVLLAQKADVAEELDRLRAHVSAVREAMQKGQPCGRRLDFLMQELNREANTLGSKSISLENSSGAIDLKVLIEQMREQVQNIE